MPSLSRDGIKFNVVNNLYELVSKNLKLSKDSKHPILRDIWFSDDFAMISFSNILEFFPVAALTNFLKIRWQSYPEKYELKLVQMEYMPFVNSDFSYYGQSLQNSLLNGNSF